MDSPDLVHALEFNDQFVLYANVNSVTAIEPNVFVLHCLGLLKLEGNSIASQFVRQTLFVRRLKQTGSQLTMNFDGAPDDSIGQVVKLHVRGILFIYDSMMEYAGQSGTAETLRFQRAAGAGFALSR